MQTFSRKRQLKMVLSVNKSLPVTETGDQEGRRRRMIEEYFQGITGGTYLLECVMQEEVR